MVKRRIKKEVIVISDDESTNGQPSEKNARREEVPAPLPNAEMVELQKKVVKLEDMYQRAVRAAGVSEKARQAAESLLDSKQGILVDSKKELEEELQTRLAEYSAQLDEARRRVEEATAREMNAARESDAAKIAMVELRRMMETAVKEKDQATKDKFALEQELEETKVKSEHSNDRNNELVLENFALMAELDESRKKKTQMNDDLLREISRLKVRLAESKKLNDKSKYRKDFAPDRFAEIVYENAMLKEDVDELRRNIIYSARTKLVTVPNSIYSINKTINIFQLCYYGEPGTISIDEALRRIDPRFKECGQEKWAEFCESRDYLALACFECNKSLNMTSSFHHFISHRHATTVRKCSRTHVFLTAVEHWLQMLQQAVDAAAAATAAEVVEIVEAAPAAWAAAAADAVEVVEIVEAAPAAGAAAAADAVEVVEPAAASETAPAEVAASAVEAAEVAPAAVAVSTAEDAEVVPAAVAANASQQRPTTLPSLLQLQL